MRSDPPEDDVARTPASAALRALRDRLRESMLSLPGLVLLGSVVVALVLARVGPEYVTVDRGELT